LLFVLLVVISWLVTLLLGFFIPGPLSALLTWLWFGVALVLLQCLWCSLYRHPQYAVGGRSTADALTSGNASATAPTGSA
jgi:hypothetical protein